MTSRVRPKAFGLTAVIRQVTSRFQSKTAMLIAAAVAVVGCDTKQTPLPEDKAEYAGQWVGQDMQLTIKPEGRIEYKRDSTEINAPIQKYEDEDFVVGAYGLSTKFDVQTPPHEKDGSWYMTVDGVDLMRVNIDDLIGQIQIEVK